jgi:hypothetical protein
VLLVFGAGTGLIFILRWFWWRINAWSEIAAMFASGIISISLKLTPVGAFFFGPEIGVFPDWTEYLFVVFATTFIWLLVTYITQPESKEVLQNFYRKIQPGGPGWKKVLVEAEAEHQDLIKIKEKWSVPAGIAAMLLGCVLIYSCMFCTGYLIYGKYTQALFLLVSAIVSGFLLARVWNRMKKHIL